MFLREAAPRVRIIVGVVALKSRAGTALGIVAHFIIALVANVDVDVTGWAIQVVIVAAAAVAVVDVIVQCAVGRCSHPVITITTA